jgi:PPOX class probable F420-dependent enzyme
MGPKGSALGGIQGQSPWPCFFHRMARRVRSTICCGRMLSDAQRHFLDAGRVAHLATADARGTPHVVPVCYAVAGASLYITIDEKPKRQDVPLKRLRNILANPTVVVTVDRWDEDWTRLAWVMLRGRAEILHDGAEHDRAQALLRERYPQYRTMVLAPLPVIALRIERATGWGRI